MKASIFLIQAGVVAMALSVAGCDRNRTESQNGVLQTRFPGMVAAGGGTSGQVVARTGKPVTDATYAGGTPGIAGGSGGTTGGAATGGTVQETGKGPSEGVTPPSSAGRPGTHLPPGDFNHGGATGTAPGAGSPPRAEPATGAGQRTEPGAGTAAAGSGTAGTSNVRPASTGSARLGSSTPAHVASPSNAPSGVAGASMGNTETTTVPAVNPPPPGAGR
jgi:hypothetical protein